MGGGNASSTNVDSAVGGTTGAATLSLTVVDSTGSATTTVTYNGGQRIRAIYKDAANVPIANKAVTFSVTFGISGTVLAATSALTDSSGVAYVGVSSSGPTAAGVATVSATAGVTTSTRDFAVSAQGSDVLVVTLVNSADVSISSATYGGGQRVKAVFTSASGVPKVGAVVNFNMSAGSSGALAASSAITNSNGVAYVSVGPASAASVGVATVTGSVGTVVGIVNFSVDATGTGAPTLSLSVIDSAGNATTTVTYNGGQGIRAVYRDAANAPIANKAVSFSVIKGVAGTDLAIASALTDSNGVANVSVRSSGPTAAGAATVSATAGTTTSTVDFAVSALGSDVLTVNLVNSADVGIGSAVYGGGQRIKAVFTNAAGVLKVGAVVSFSISSGSGAILAASSAVTNSSGVAYVDVGPASAASVGAATVTGFVGNVVGVVNFSITATSAGAPTLSLTVVNSAGSGSVDTVSFGGSQKLKFTYKKADGVTPIAGVRVTFAITSGAALVTLATESALTGVDGVATVLANTTSATAVGAATATASVITSAGTASTNVDFAVAATPVTLGSIQFGSTSLAASTTTSVGISATANGSPVSAVPVSLSADCGSLSPAIALTSGSGLATSTYSSVKTDGTSCSGAVRVTATSSGTTQTRDITVASPVASSVNFVSASPASIYVQGSGSTTQSILKFRVLDGTGLPYANASVTAAITTNPGGVGLGAANSVSDLSQQSDSLGYVTFTIYAGTLPGPVQVKVKLSDSAYAFSNNITVQSGPPTQDRFSLSVGTFNIEGQNIDGSTTSLSVRVADRQGNAVPDGTVINFTSGGGQVQPSCVTTRTNGISGCSVTFSSQAPRATNGRVSILAFAEGVKNFTDVNRNNVFDSGDTLIDIGDAYRDDNEDGEYNAGEFVIPRGGIEVCPTSNWGTPSRALSCDSSTSATTVRSQAVLFMATSEAVLTQEGTLDELSTSISMLTFRANSTTKCSKGIYCLPLAAGTAFTAETTDATSCTAGAVVGSTVPNISPTGNLNQQLGTLHSLLLTAADGKTCSKVIVRVTAKSPSGLGTIVSFKIP